MQRNDLIFNIGYPTSVLKAQPRQGISNIYIYLYVSYQSVYTGSEFKANHSQEIGYIKPVYLHMFHML